MEAGITVERLTARLTSRRHPSAGPTPAAVNTPDRQVAGAGTVNWEGVVEALHDDMYEYEPEIDSLLSRLDLPNPYRFQSPVVALSWQIHEYKEAAGPAYQVGSQMFCDRDDWSVERPAAGTTG